MAQVINFTKSTIEALPLPAKNCRTEYQDAKNPALCCRVYGSGKKSFCVLRRVKRGGLKRITIGSFPAMSVDQAKSRAIELIAELERGEDPSERLRRQRKSLTLDQLFELYMERESKPRKKTWRDDLSRYAHHIQKTLGRRRANEITRSELSSLHVQLSVDLSGASANRVLALLSAIFNWAIRVEILAQNPVVQIRKNREMARDRFVTREELPHLFAALEAEQNETIRDFLEIALYTGARYANVLQMRFVDIDWQGAVWRIEMTKNGLPQNVALVEPALEILRRRADASSSIWVFAGVGAKGHLADPHSGWNRVIRRATNLRLISLLRGLSTATPLISDAQILQDDKRSVQTLEKLANTHGLEKSLYDMTDLRIHDLRRTLGSWQVITGSSLPVVGKSLNHKSPASTAIYARLDLDPIRASLDRATKEMLHWGRQGLNVSTHAST